MSLDRVLVSAVVYDRYVSEKKSEEDFFSIVANFHPRKSGGYQSIAQTYDDVKRASVGWHHDGKPYVEHLRVVTSAGMLLGLTRVEQINTGLHHDTGENFRDTFPMEKVRERNGEQVYANTQILSREERPTTPEEIARADERYAMRFVRLVGTDRWWLILVKLIDRLHNMKTYRTFYAGDEQRYARKLNETINVFLPLADQIGYGDVFRFFIKQWLGVEVPGPKLR